MKWCCRLIEVSRETVFWKVSKQITAVGCVRITAFGQQQDCIMRECSVCE
jgi:hypothetical protein